MCPSSSIGGDIPDSRWYGRHGSYGNLRTFGCKAFAHIRQGKLEARALECIMIGYQSGVKGYRLWCIEPGNGKIIVSRDVIFSENELPFKKDCSTSEDGKVTVPDVEVETETEQQQSEEVVSESGPINPPHHSNNTKEL